MKTHFRDGKFDLVNLIYQQQKPENGPRSQQVKTRAQGPTATTASNGVNTMTLPTRVYSRAAIRIWMTIAANSVRHANAISKMDSAGDELSLGRGIAATCCALGAQSSRHRCNLSLRPVACRAGWREIRLRRRVACGDRRRGQPRGAPAHASAGDRNRPVHGDQRRNPAACKPGMIADMGRG